MQLNHILEPVLYNGVRITCLPYADFSPNISHATNVEGGVKAPDVLRVFCTNYHVAHISE